MSETDYIRKISKAGDERGNLLQEFLETTGLSGLKDATKEQLREFCEEKKI